ncbi:hypothetical protein WQO_19075 [Streptomyces globisporus C-1027]|uniref:Uncharacterized protein n=1 Tax=Streptomyces globisporus C-1027 TaxID=1172567 RepID=A0A0U3D3Y8_STRGL|nr:hypothetical protein [Streptomyces globisporus]ALU95236.1 hypothetical protein WQO_19075 [Streptomyces globisporus C-1027]
MSAELTVALVGVGGAFGGAIIGGVAAMASASITGKRTMEAATKTYQGALDVARRTAQQQAYTLLLNAANRYEEATEGQIDAAAELIEALCDRSQGIPSELSEARLQAHRNVVSEVRSLGEVLAAVRVVGLEGPSIVHEAAKSVRDSASNLARLLESVEEVNQFDNGEFNPIHRPQWARRRHDALRSSIEDFGVIARLNGGYAGSGDVE